MPVKFGIDIIIASAPSWKTKRIGLLTNDAAKTNTGVLSRKALIDAGFNIVKLFSPEHGITASGADGAKMLDGIDDVTAKPIISLYGEKMKPTKQDMQDIELLLFDIPDAGTRFYTYLWSLTYFIETAAENKLKIVLLDRPNPLGGNFELCEGPMLHESVASFIGRFDIPIKHQSTFGELGKYLNTTQGWHADLEVIHCENWKRNAMAMDWHLPWVKPSPALQNVEACMLYPGLCFFEATNVSVGRGTKHSFEWIGATWLNLPAIAMVWQNLLREEIKIETIPLSISQSNGEVQETKGIRIKIIDPSQYRSVMTGLLLLKLIKDLHPQDFKWQSYPTQANPSGENHLSLLMGIPNAQQLFEQPLQIWLQHITKLVRVTHWQKEISPYLIYQ
ncbi:MAG: DUF1343 domain-containing protein [Chitinophagia bacterium]|jgi:uncharacterized protein YbbC (DUF1343 family)|nr:DUF1343 domain-containing protein [Chitinophagia bacterium]